MYCSIDACGQLQGTVPAAYGASKNRRKLSAMCEHKRECLGSPRCPAMLPTKVSGR